MGVGVDRPVGEKQVRLPVVALLAATLAGAATAQKNGAPEIALTFDDLPLHAPIPQGDSAESVGAGLAAALASAHVPAYGFVNAHWVEQQPATRSVLEGWQAAGLSLGNHGWSHQHLSQMTIPQFEEELTRDEPVLQDVAKGRDWHWFRYPFLDEGTDAAQRQAARDVLARHGYKIADVTMDFGDWQWTAPYARCRETHDDASIETLKRMYLAAAREAITHYRTLSKRLFGRDIPYVILLHESAFEARMAPQLIALFRTAGFRFVTLPEAESDPYYSDRLHPDLPPGPSGLDARASARGIGLPGRTDYGAKLAAICSQAGPTETTP
jgi:peptidoglycan/xylan/chitin deacetylase (PgdA/CDA1 family)